MNSPQYLPYVLHRLCRTYRLQYLLYVRTEFPDADTDLPARKDDHGNAASSEDYPTSDRDSMTPPIHGELTRFSVAFPFTPIGSPGDVRQLIESHLPTWDRATHLAESYVINAAWLFQSVTKEQVLT